MPNKTLFETIKKQHMKHLILYAVFFLLIIGCKKSSLQSSMSSSKDSVVTGNTDTISHVETGGWSFQLNGGSILSGDVTTCLMVQGTSGSQYQLVMSGPVANNWYSLALVMDMPSTVPVAGIYVAFPSTKNQIQINYEYAENSFIYYLSD
jgi:hypothetical protein